MPLPLRCRARLLEPKLKPPPKPPQPATLGVRRLRRRRRLRRAACALPGSCKRVAAKTVGRAAESPTPWTVKDTCYCYWLPGTHG